MKRFVLLTCLLALSGCETCREQPGACAVAASIAVTCVALSSSHHRDRAHDVFVVPPNCANGSCQ